MTFERFLWLLNWDEAGIHVAAEGEACLRVGRRGHQIHSEARAKRKSHVCLGFQPE